VLGAAIVMFFGTACSKRKEPTDSTPGKVLPVPENRDEKGWPFYEVAAEGFGLALPPDWRQFDMDPKRFQAKYDEVMAKNPELAHLLSNARQQIANGVKFFGFDQATVGTGFATNVNVLRHPIPPGQTLDTVVAETIRQIDGVPEVAKPVVHERVTLASGARERLRYNISMRSPDGKSNVLVITQYIVVKGTDSYIVTMTTGRDQEDKYAKTFDGIGRSFRPLK
jgi:hypothetical protein